MEEYLRHKIEPPAKTGAPRASLLRWAAPEGFVHDINT